jgi:hypothetical protein
MARDGSGTYTRVSNSFTAPVAGTTISPTDADAFWDELDTEITDSLSRTGKGGMSADLDMNNNDINEIKTAVFQGSTSGNTTVIATAIAGTTTLTLPAATDTLVGKDTTDTLTNKTLTSPTLNSPTLVTPALGVATATSINKVAITAPASAATLTIPDGVTLTGPASSGTAMTLGNTETVTGVKTFGSAGAVGRLKVAGTTSGAVTLDATAVAGTGVLTLPNATDTLVGKATTDTFTNKTFDTAGTGNSFSISGAAVTTNTGTGAVARASSPVFTTPSLGAAIATSINGSTVSPGHYSGEPSNASAAAGEIGEFISSTVLAGSAVSLTTATAANITSISLTAGDWDVWGSVAFAPNGATTMSVLGGWISTTSATLPTAPNEGAEVFFQLTFTTGTSQFFAIGQKRISLSATTTVYLSAYSAFAVNTNSAYGFIGARRAR